MTGWASWQPWVIGSIAATLILWYVVRALFADRARGRPRCVRCAQPFTEEQGLVCTECGWTASSPRDLLRTRRHWGKAALGLLVLLMAAMFVRIQAQNGNPLVILPDRVLVWSLPLDPSDPTGRGPVSAELQRRLIERSDDEGGADVLVGLCLDAVIAGDISSAPGTETWFKRYGALALDLRDGFVDPGSEAAGRLATIPPRVKIEIPPAWPEDRPVPASLEIRDLWALGTESVIDVHWADAGDAPPVESIGYRNLASIRRRHHFLLPPPKDWPASGALEIRVRNRSLPDAVVAQIEGGMTPQAVEIVASNPWTTATPTTRTLTRPTDTTMPLEPWPGDEITDRDIAGIFNDGLRRWPKAARPYAIRFDIRRLEDPRYDGVLFGLLVEIVERAPDGGETVHRRTRIWMPGGRDFIGGNGTRRNAGWTISEEDIEGLDGAFDPENESDWVLRIRGDESLARRGLAIVETGSENGHDRWWSGMVERPLPTETIPNGRPFIRMWFDSGGVKSPAAAAEPSAE
ncbi:MAG: hypothetical protein CMJ34_11105 [Phycisphaerae bacterium]|nr:hypothetical protein [Phycisphaerae bacterium]